MTTLVVVVLVLVLLLAALRLYITANRLDRLHNRTEAAWMALEGALARRIVASRAVAATGGLQPRNAEKLRRLADHADRADRPTRADAENDLSRGLATLTDGADPELAAELADASERVVLARRFYNDAVRDTRALRAVRFTRMFRLAGHAALPDYFEISEARPVPAAARAAVAALVVRTAARVVLLDSDDRVLLLSATDPRSTPERWWMTPGGGVEEGEDLSTAAIRELAEETGVALTDRDLVGPIWRRTARFVFTGVDYEQTEYYFAARRPHPVTNGDPSAAATPGSPPGSPPGSRPGSPAGLPPGLSDAGQTEIEHDIIIGFRWWAGADMPGSGDPIFPVELATRLPEVTEALATRVAPATVPDVR